MWSRMLTLVFDVFQVSFQVHGLPKCSNRLNGNLQVLNRDLHLIPFNCLQNLTSDILPGRMSDVVSDVGLPKSQILNGNLQVLNRDISRSPFNSLQNLTLGMSRMWSLVLMFFRSVPLRVSDEC